MFASHNVLLPDGTYTAPGQALVEDSAAFQAALRALNEEFGSDSKGLSLVDLGCLEGGYAVGFARAGYNVTGVEFGGFVGATKDRKTIYDVFGNVYKSGTKYPPGWFGYSDRGQPIEVSSSGSGATASGAHAILAEERILGLYPFADIPPNFDYNYYTPDKGGKQPSDPFKKP